MENTNSDTPLLPKDNYQPAPPVILQDDQPLDGSMTTTLSFETGADTNIGATMMDSNQPAALTDTLSSFSSDYSYLGGSNNNTLSTFSSATSTSGSRRNSMQFSKPHEVKETLDASVTQNEDGSRQLKNYSLIKVIGKGAFGKVHLAIDPETKVHYAAKEFSKSKLRKKDKANLFNLGPRGRGRGGRRRGPGADDAPGLSAGSPLDLIRGEVAILKKLNHPNIVRLYEVLDVATDDSMYMIFEYCEQGALMEVSLTEEYKAAYGDAECRSVFRQIILGIEYLHEHGIIHRDIKPDNLLRSHGVVKIVDFGVSEMFDKKGDDMTKKSAGSPAFMAPELCRPDHGEVSGRATDIWSMGITLYCLRYGRLPYVSESILEMQRVIREEDFEIPEEKDPRFESLIRKLLEKDPNKRITIDELRNDPWVTDDDKWPLMSKEENTATAVTNITEAELKGAIRKINSLAAVFKFISNLKASTRNSASRSAVTSPSTAGDVQHIGSSAKEDERMQDADEGVLANAKVLVPAKNAEDPTMTAIIEMQDQGLKNVSLEDIKPDAETKDGQEHQLASVTIPAQEAEEVTAAAPISEATETKKLQEVTAQAGQAEEKEEPEGYEVCDFETGMCYWVPAKEKSKPAESEPTPAATVEPKEAEKTEQAEVALEQQDAPAIQVASKVVSEETKESQVDTATSTTASVAPESPRTVSPGPGQRNASTPSGDTSPAPSLAPGPRLVGKLSRDRLAMFEKSA